MSLSKKATPFTARSLQAEREVRRNSPLRQARTCYDHLAGVAGVELMDQLLRRGWLEAAGEARGRLQFQITASGKRELSRRGVKLLQSQGSRRSYAYGCVDWTERRFHLGGALGAGILRSLVGSGMIRRDAGIRVVASLKPVHRWLE